MKRNTHWHIPVPLSEVPVRKALETLPGRHDFAAFQAAGGTAKTTVRTLRSVDLEIRGSEWILTVSGDAFLYNMVRIIAGTAAEIGLGRLATDAFAKAFETQDRLALGMTAPAHGLELTEVRYPDLAFTDPARLRWHEDDPSTP